MEEKTMKLFIIEGTEKEIKRILSDVFSDSKEHSKESFPYGRGSFYSGPSNHKGSISIPDPKI